MPLLIIRKYKKAHKIQCKNYILYKYKWHILYVSAFNEYPLHASTQEYPSLHYDPPHRIAHLPIVSGLFHKQMNSETTIYISYLKCKLFSSPYLWYVD